MKTIWRTCLLLFLLNSVQPSSVKSPTEDTSNETNSLLSENKNRIKSKHLEMWDIIVSILERKTTLQSIANQRFFLPEQLFKDDSKNKSKCGKHCNRENVGKLDRDQLNYIQQYYNFNVEMSTFLLNELKTLSQLERECQALV